MINQVVLMLKLNIAYEKALRFGFNLAVQK